MKRKFFVVILAVLAFACLSLSLSACDINTGSDGCQHEFLEWTVTVKATCTVAGTKTRTCKKCLEVQTEKIEALEHEVSTEWTIGEDTHYHLCTNENCSVKFDEASHLDDDHDHNCDVCGAKISDHVGGTATCTDKATCTVCGEKYGEPLGHDFEGAKVVYELIYDDEGYLEDCTATRKCTKNCGEEGCTETVFCDEFIFDFIPATCKEYAKNILTVVFVEDWADDYVVGPFVVGDTYGEHKGCRDDDILTYSLTFDDDQQPIVTATTICTVCGTTLTAIASEVTVSIDREADCYETELTEYKAKFDVDWAGSFEAGEMIEYIYKVTAPVRHDYGEVTYTWNGYTECTAVRTCKNCEDGTEGHTQTIHATITSQITQKQTCQTPEKTTYTATFAEDWAETQIIKDVQTKDVKDHNWYQDLNDTWCLDCGYCTFTKELVFNYDEENDRYTVAGLNSDEITDVIIPGHFCGKPVYAIESSAFGGKTNIKSITFDENGWLNSIGDYAFSSCEALTAITIPKTVKSIGEMAFYGCTALKTVTHGSGVETIGYLAFSNCSALETLTLNDGLKSIGERAFFDCTSLNSVVIPDSVTSIGTYLFAKCTSLTSLTIGSGVTSMGDRIAYGCSALETLTIKEGVKVIADYSFYDCSSIESVVIPDGVEYIGKMAFYGCSSLKAVTIGNVEKIDERAFASCQVLETLTLNEGIKKIEYGAFYNCTSLKSVLIPDSVTSIGQQAFYECTSLTSLTIGSGVEEMGSEAFYDCSSLETLTLKEGVKVIGETAFKGCSSITSVTVPDSVTKIGDSAFSKCSGITEITLGANLTELTDEVFSGTTNLTSIIFRAPITKVNTSFFDGIDTEKITLTLATGQKILSKNSATGKYEATEERFYEGVTFCDKVFKKIVVSPEEVDAQNMTSSELQTKLESLVSQGERNFAITLASDADSDMFPAIDDGLDCAKDGSISLTISGVESIPSFAFYNCAQLRSVIFGDNVKTIGDYAFRYCENLTVVTLGTEITSVGDYAFEGCSKLYEVVNNSNLEITAGETANGYVAKYAQSVHSGESLLQVFEDYIVISDDEGDLLVGYTGSDTEIVLPNKFLKDTYVVTSSAFYNSNITSITIPKSVTAIGDKAFKWTTLTKVSFAEGSKINSIGDEAFYSCYDLTSISIPESVTSLGESIFENCTKLTTVTFSANCQVKTIGKGAFYNCSALESISIPESVTSLGESIFENCTKLTTVTFSENCQIDKIPDSAFRGCYLLASITIPSSVTSIGKYAFAPAQYGNTTMSLNSVAFKEGSKLNLIDMNAFYKCASLTSFVFPDSVTTINSFAFSECENLMTVTLGAKLATIEVGAFSGCNNLLEVVNNSSLVITAGSTDHGNVAYYAKSVHAGESQLRIQGDYVAICSDDGDTLVAYLGSDTEIVLPDKFVKDTYAIGEAAFKESVIVSITIPASVTSLGEKAFYNCYKLTTVSFGTNSKLSYIGEEAFSSCHSLTSVAISANGVEIDEKAFSNCFSLTKLTDENGKIGSVGANAFEYCYALTSIAFASNAKTIGEYAFYNTGLTTITFDDNCQLETIGKFAFSACYSIQSIVIPNNVTSIGNYAFDNCTGLSSIIIPKSVTSIGRGAFEGCTKLAIVENYSGLKIMLGKTTYGGVAYYAEQVISYVNGYEFIERVWDEDSDEVLLCLVGYNGTDTELTLPSLNERSYSVKSYAFNLNDKITSVTVSKYVTSIGTCAFSDCTALTTVTFEEDSTLTEIETSAFEGCIALSSITIPQSVTTIGMTAFYNCTELSTVTFEEGSSLTEISSHAFRNCSKLSSITIPTSVTKIGESAFDHCTALSSITIPKSVTYVGENVFNGWTSQQTIYVVATEKGAEWSDNWLGNSQSNFEFGYTES